jgi:hypothetical protein
MPNWWFCKVIKLKSVHRQVRKERRERQKIDQASQAKRISGFD